MNAVERQTDLLLPEMPTDVSLAQRDIAEAHAAGRSAMVADLSAAMDGFFRADCGRERGRLLRAVHDLRAEYRERKGAR